MSDTALTLTIDRVGRRGEGVADGPIFVPYTLPGEHVRVWRAGERAELDAVLEPSPDRIAPFCPYFGTCGGCAIQHWAAAAYQDWKRGLVVTALTRANITTPRSASPRRLRTGPPPSDVSRPHPAGRARPPHRRGRLYARPRAYACQHRAVSRSGARARRRRADGAPCRRAAARSRQTSRHPDHGDRGRPRRRPAWLRCLSARLRQAAIGLAHAQDLARLSNHGDVLIERRPPTLMFGAARVTLPAGGFLQATTAGEAALVAAVREAVGPARRIADLFAGVGTFTLPLAQQTEVHAFEQDRAALAALTRGAGGSGPALRPVTAQVRDLVGRPLAGAELDPYDAVVLDPPRAGAEAQMRALAPSKVPLVISVSCAVETFARDAALLLAGGYVCESVRPFDQFRHTPHVEIVGVFRRAPPSRKRLRRLLG